MQPAPSPPPATTNRPINHRWQELRRLLRGTAVSVVVHATGLIVLAMLGIAWQQRPELLTLVVGPTDESLETLDLAIVEMEPVDWPPDQMAEFSLPPPTDWRTDVGNVAASPFDQVAGTSSGTGRTFAGIVAYASQHGLDVVVVFDSTGSMGREIDAVKRRINVIGRALLEKIPQTRVSLVTYRDTADTYIVKGIPLTNDLSGLIAFLSPIAAGGGGNRPEAVHRGLAWALEYNEFRDRARKVILIFGDAPPHRQHAATCTELARQFRSYQKGVVSTVSCRSGAPIPEFYDVARAGGGEAYTLDDSQRLMEELLVLVFGSEHREDVETFFALETVAKSSESARTPRRSHRGSQSVRRRDSAR